MTLLDFIRLLMHYKRWLVILPLVIAAIVFALTARQPQIFRSQMLLYTGIVPSSDGDPNGMARVDVFAVNNAFDNLQTIITSRQVLEETSLRLLASHLIKYHGKGDSLEASLKKNLDEHPVLIAGPVSKALTNPQEQLEKMARNNQLQWFLEDESSPYSYKRLKEKLKIRRTGSSDLLELSFEANEASVARETLALLSDAFARRYKEIRKTEAGSMVSFFEKEVAKAAQSLSVRGDEMTQFQKQNRIINYYEQTHLTAIETEHLNGEYYNELMKLAASEEALNELKGKLGYALDLALSSKEIIESQQKLATLRTKKLLSDDVKLDSIMSIQIKEEEAQLQSSLDHLYVDGRTPEGVSKKEVLNQWLDQFIAVSEGKARVEIMKQRKSDQEKMYDFFAPLGSKLHNYERQMDVAEREYLDLLHSLNQARLREQNLETTNNLSVVDEPNYPVKAEPSKRKILVVAAWLGSLVLLMSIIIGIEYLDSSLQSPERSEVKTGLDVAGALPDETGPVHSVAWSNLMTQLLSKIDIHDSTIKQRVLLISRTAPASCQQIGEQLKQNLLALGASCSVHTTQESKTDDVGISINVVSNLIDAAAHWSLLRKADVVLYVADANLSWNTADKKNIQLLQRTTTRQPMLLLTGVLPDRLENWLGELPKRRSGFRIGIKRLVQFQFH